MPLHTNSKLANDYQLIRDLVEKFGIKKFHDVGNRMLLHQLMALSSRR